MVLQRGQQIIDAIEGGEERAARLYHAVEDLLPVFTEWKEIQAEQIEELKKLRASIDKNTKALGKKA